MRGCPKRQRNDHGTTAYVGAVAAILLWSSLATLCVSLGDLPPLYVTGVSLCLGGCLSLPFVRRRKLQWKPLTVGSLSMLFYHLLLIMALRSAPAVSANLVHYSWPMLIVLLSPLVLKQGRLHLSHIVSALLGFVGAGVAIAGGSFTHLELSWGYLFAIVAALVWATYSLTLRRFSADSVSNVGPACVVAGGLSLMLHVAIEPAVPWPNAHFPALLLLGIGPMGAAFYLWAHALKEGDPRVIGVMANATPLLSTGMLAVFGYGTVTGTLLFAAILVTVASLLALSAGEISLRASSSKLPPRASNSVSDDRI